VRELAFGSNQADSSVFGGCVAACTPPVELHSSRRAAAVPADVVAVIASQETEIEAFAAHFNTSIGYWIKLHAGIDLFAQLAGVSSREKPRVRSAETIYSQTSVTLFAQRTSVFSRV